MREKKSFAWKWVVWVLALGWAVVLFVFSGQNGMKSGELSRRFTQWLLRVVPSLPWSVAQLEPVLRKIAHFGIFALEGFLLCVAMLLSVKSGAWAALISTAVCASVAALNEYHQSFIAGRNAAFGDVLIDTSGAITGILFACLIVYIVRRALKRRRNVII